MKTILVLEDDPSNMQIFCALLWSKGFQVLEATTGHEAIQISNNEVGSIDLLVSDLQLPDLSGTQVALQLVESRPDLPILFVSGTPMFDWTERDLRNFRHLPAGAVDFLEKPFGVSTLEKKIKDLLHNHICMAAFHGDG
jgi:two-component system cell cycle sensor histidine kinase/response regulator CckA